MTSLSLVLCTYNGDAFLAEQLASLAAQTRPPDEMVIRDDGSTDRTMQILEAFAIKASFPVSLEKNPVRLGIPDNFWSAIHDTSGDVVALCDQDDIWMPSKLERAVEVLDRDPKVGATFSDGWCIDNTGALMGRSLWDRADFTVAERARFEAEEELEVLLRHNVVTGATLVFRSALLPALAPGPDMPHDYWISVAVAKRSLVVPMREPLIKYRLHDSNTIGLLPKFRLGHRVRYVFIPEYRRRALSTRFSQLNDLTRLLGEAPCPKVTSEQRRSLESRMAKLRLGLSYPESLWHRLSFVPRG